MYQYCLTVHLHVLFVSDPAIDYVQNYYVQNHRQSSLSALFLYDQIILNKCHLFYSLLMHEIVNHLFFCFFA